MGKWFLIWLLALASSSVLAQAMTADQSYRLGLEYRNGEGRGRDAAAAVRYVTSAAERGLPQAMYTLSHMLAEGEGTAPDPGAARRWLEAAAELDYPEALQELALLETDPRRAAELMREAAHALQHRAREQGALR
jgi:TPR repeat protein